MTEQAGGWSLRVVDSYDEVASIAADAVTETVARVPDAAITLPTGSTPIGMYEELVRRVRAGEIDLNHAHIFTLDEYLGQRPDDVASLTRWLFETFLTPAGIPDTNIHLVPAAADDPEAAAAAYEADLAVHGGLELAVLGLGPNGHIAFNEPGSPPDSRTRVLDLEPGTIRQSEEYWKGDTAVPHRAMTLGLGTILEARRIVLIVSGASKSEIVRASLEGPQTLDVPASWLRNVGSRLEVVLDRAAASGLSDTAG